jgi:hypothetical protein
VGRRAGRPATAQSTRSAGPPTRRPRSTQAEAASQELTSAGLLNLLHRRLGALGGDAAGRALVERLLAAAAAPYFEILGKWLAAGVLDDPYSEFMVKVRAGRPALVCPSTRADWDAHQGRRRVLVCVGAQPRRPRGSGRRGDGAAAQP